MQWRLLIVGALALLITLSLGSNTHATGSALIAVDVDTLSPGVQSAGGTALGVPEAPVDIVIENADAIGSFELEIIYDPSYLQLTRWTVGPFLASSGRSVSCQQLLTSTTIDLGCATFGASPPGASGDGLLATLYFRPKVLGDSCLLLTTAKTSDVLGDTRPTDAQSACLTIVPNSVDTDGDGCRDAEELGALHLLGGQRDRLSYWDFFDVPAPALSSANVNGTRDHAVSIIDVIAILYYIGAADGRAANGNGVRYNDDLNANGIPDGREYDRRPSSVAGMPWRSGPPDGSVSINDAIIELNQIGDHCTPL